MARMSPDMEMNIIHNLVKSHIVKPTNMSFKDMQKPVLCISF